MGGAVEESHILREDSVINSKAVEGYDIQNLETDAERKLIKNGYINFETTDVQASRIFINKLIAKYKCYITSEDEDNSSKRIDINLIIKVPEGNFDSFFADIEGAEKNISNKSVEIQDVTEEFIDITARLKVKKEAEQTYLRLLNTAKTVRDVLDIQYQMQSIRGEIEGIEGRLKYLEKAVAYSTLNIHMYQFIAKSDVILHVSFFRRVLASLKSGVIIFGEVIIAMLNAWIFFLIAFILAGVIKWKFFNNKERK